MTDATQTRSGSLFERITSQVEAGFRQKTDYTCGPASLSLVTDALGIAAIDESEWIAPRFSRWLNVDQFPSRGISLQELLCVAEMNLRDCARVSIQRAYPENLTQFLTELERSSRGECALVLNFAQDQLTGDDGGWQGSPHFSPVSGYRSESHEVLIADVDREIQTPYWKEVDRVFAAMAVINPAFQIPRGWLTIWPRGKPWEKKEASVSSRS